MKWTGGLVPSIFHLLFFCVAFILFAMIFVFLPRIHVISSSSSSSFLYSNVNFFFSSFSSTFVHSSFFYSKLTPCFVDIFADRHIRKFMGFWCECLPIPAKCEHILKNETWTQSAQKSMHYRVCLWNSMCAKESSFQLRQAWALSVNIILTMMVYAFEIILLHLHEFFRHLFTKPSILVNVRVYAICFFRFSECFFSKITWNKPNNNTNWKKEREREQKSVAHLCRHFRQFSTLCGNKWKCAKLI